MNLQEFTARYVVTLRTDPETGGAYIKVPVADLNELGCMQESLVHGIRVLAQDDECNPTETRVSIYWLCRLLLAGYPCDELEGLAELLKK